MMRDVVEQIGKIYILIDNDAVTLQSKAIDECHRADAIETILNVAQRLEGGY
ncbi:MAG: hypothetical protein WBW03_00925 [Silvibacterium sp.]